ncbi:MAG: CoA pyrophosphatase [Desulfuromonadaceae bacterium]|nr:CoA pyrophosphatase [Desulfuromonadaceae bacterium]
MISLPNCDDIARTLAVRRPQLLPPQAAQRCAAVALVLREQQQGGPEILLMQRTVHRHDPWSGNLSFPGGRIDPEDESACAAAKRETQEEVALDLEDARLLGQLDDEYGVRVPIRVSGFVFEVETGVSVQLNNEASRYFWVPFSRLLEPGNHASRTVLWEGSPVTVSSFHIAESVPPLWGLTYRFLIQLLRHTGLTLPA